MSPPHYLVNPKVISSYWDFAAATGQVVREWNCVCFHFTSLVTCRMMGWLSQAFNVHIFARTCPICFWTNRRETGHRVNLQIYRMCGADNQEAWQKALAILLYARSISCHFQQINNSWWIMRLIGGKNNFKQMQTQRMDTFNLSYDVACLKKLVVMWQKNNWLFMNCSALGESKATSTMLEFCFHKVQQRHFSCMVKRFVIT